MKICFRLRTFNFYWLVKNIFSEKRFFFEHFENNGVSNSSDSRSANENLFSFSSFLGLWEIFLEKTIFF